MKNRTVIVLCKHLVILIAVVLIVVSFGFYLHLSITKQKLQDVNSLMDNGRIFYVDVEEDEYGGKLMIADDYGFICPYLKHKLKERVEMCCHDDKIGFFSKQRHITFKQKV